MKKYLITGASGFIGSALKNALEKKGYKVIVLPRNLLFKPKLLKEFIGSQNPQHIFHLAAYGNRYFQTDEEKMVKVNIQGTMNLLQALRDVDFYSFINTGSSSEYGIKRKPMKETDSLDTDTFYGATKVSATFICRAFAKKYNKSIVTVRPFSVYGPGEKTDKFIPTVIDRCKENKTLQLSPGVHDWIFIEDYIDALLKISKNAKKLQGREINIGTGVQSSNMKIVNIVQKIIGKKIKIEKVNLLRDYDTKVSWVADNRVLKNLGWKYNYDLQKGIKKIING